jgi:hypothetical protein
MANNENEPLKDFSQNMPQGINTDTEQGFIHAALIAAAGPMLSAAAASPKAAKELRELFAKAEPLEIIIEDSFQTKDDFHKVYFCIANRSSHGIYLESVQLERPDRDDVHATVDLRDMTLRDGFSIPPPKPERPVFPRLLVPSQKLHLALKLNMCDESELKREPYGLLALTYSKLDEKRPAVKPIEFRLRRDS